MTLWKSKLTPAGDKKLSWFNCFNQVTYGRIFLPDFLKTNQLNLMVKSGKVLSLQIPILFFITFLELNKDVLTTTTTNHTKICWKGCNNYLAKVNN